MKNILQSLLFGAVCGFSAFLLLDYGMGIPDVKFSYSTNECVEVENYPTVMFGTTQYSCENMPTKFNHIWVK